MVMVDPEPLRPSRPSTEGPPKLSPEEQNIRRRNVRTACVLCKRKKLKCSGTRPCENCHKIGTACEVNEDGDQRRKRVLRQKLETLEGKGQLLDRVVAALREADEVVAAQVTNLIRSHSSLEEICAYIDDILGRSALEKTPELVEACRQVQEWDDSEQAARALRLETGPEDPGRSPLFHVPARPWTKTTDDDRLVSKLLSFWFTWSHPFLNWIDRELFIEAMQSGDPSSPHCSPFLVNIILADACTFSDDEGAYTVGSEFWSRGLHFFQEAKQHLDAETGQVTLAKAQGLGVLYVFICMVGKDRLGWEYLHELADTANRLADEHETALADANIESLQYSKAVDHALWGLFNLTTVTGLSYQKEGLIRVPNARHPTVGLNAHARNWTNFPTSSVMIESHEQCLFKAICDVSLTTYTLTRTLFGGEQQERKLNKHSVQLVEDAYTRLKQWYEQLPDCLGSENANPHVFSLHLEYNTIIQIIYKFLVGWSKDVDEEEHGDWADTVRKQAHTRCIEAAHTNGDLINKQNKQWSLEHMPQVNVQWVTVSMFTLLEDLKEEESRQAFIHLSIAAKAMSHRWLLGKGMLKMLLVTSTQKGVVFPPETDALFRDFEHSWREADRRALKSQYPNFANSMQNGNVNEVELDAFLEKFDRLQLGPAKTFSCGSDGEDLEDPETEELPGETW